MTLCHGRAHRAHSFTRSTTCKLNTNQRNILATQSAIVFHACLGFDFSLHRVKIYNVGHLRSHNNLRYILRDLLPRNLCGSSYQCGRLHIATPTPTKLKRITKLSKQHWVCSDCHEWQRDIRFVFPKWPQYKMGIPTIPNAMSLTKIL